jgi:hypothetical protein
MKQRKPATGPASDSPSSTERHDFGVLVSVTVLLLPLDEVLPLQPTAVIIPKTNARHSNFFTGDSPKD